MSLLYNNTFSISAAATTSSIFVLGLHAFKTLMSTNLTTLLLSQFLLGTHSNILFDKSLGHFQESFIYSEACFGTRLQYLKIMALFKLGDIFVGDFDFSFLVILIIIFIWLLLLCFKIAFIGQYNYAYVSATVLLNLIKPCIHIDK